MSANSAPPSTVPGPCVQDALAADPGTAPPEPYTRVSARNFGTDPIDIERFISADFQRREYERMWSRVWQWACNSEDVPNVGDHIVYDIGERSVLLVRVAEQTATDHGIRAYHNACLHRGRQLKTGPGNSRQLTCGFHGWTWDLDGSLARIPCRWDFPQVHDDDFRLPEVRCESWSQFVFVNFDDEAEPLDQALDVLPAHFRHFPLDDKFTAAWVQKVVPANWKVLMEAFLESYHISTTHPQGAEWLGDANSQYDVWDRSSRLFTLTGVASPHLESVGDDQVYEAAVPFFTASAPGSVSTELPHGTGAREALADVNRGLFQQMLGIDTTKYSVSEMIDTTEYWVFPNWAPWAGVGNGLQYRFRPNGDDPHSSIFDVRLMFPVPAGSPRPPAAPCHRLAPGESWTNAPELLGFCEIMDQDESNLAAVQRGLRATRRTGIPYGEYQESRIRHFHALLDGYLAD